MSLVPNSEDKAFARGYDLAERIWKPRAEAAVSRSLALQAELDEARERIAELEAAKPVRLLPPRQRPPLVYTPDPDFTCEHCNGTGQPGGIKGGPEHGLCGYCRGSGQQTAARTTLAKEKNDAAG